VELSGLSYEEKIVLLKKRIKENYKIEKEYVEQHERDMEESKERRMKELEEQKDWDDYEDEEQ
jgi:hypothetical protein